MFLDPSILVTLVLMAALGPLSAGWLLGRRAVPSVPVSATLSAAMAPSTEVSDPVWTTPPAASVTQAPAPTWYGTVGPDSDCPLAWPAVSGQAA